MAGKKSPYPVLFFGIAAVYLAYWFFEGHFLFQLQHPVLKSTSIDNTYWLFCILRIPQTVMKAPLLLDSLLLALFLLSAATLNKWHVRLLLTVLIIHAVTFAVYTGVHTKSSVFFPMAVLPFCFPERKQLLSEGIRYYLCFAFASAAFFKILHGGLFHPNQFIHILENQHADLAVLNPSHITFILSEWLISHPVLANGLWYLFFLMEGAFIIGFVTQKQDFILLILLLLILIFTCLLMRILLVEFFLFIPFLFLSRLNKAKKSD